MDTHAGFPHVSLGMLRQTGKSVSFFRYDPKIVTTHYPSGTMNTVTPDGAHPRWMSN